MQEQPTRKLLVIKLTKHQFKESKNGVIISTPKPVENKEQPDKSLTSGSVKIVSKTPFKDGAKVANVSQTTHSQTNLSKPTTDHPSKSSKMPERKTATNETKRISNTSGKIPEQALNKCESQSLTVKITPFNSVSSETNKKQENLSKSAPGQHISSSSKVKNQSANIQTKQVSEQASKKSENQVVTSKTSHQKSSSNEVNKKQENVSKNISVQPSKGKPITEIMKNQSQSRFEKKPTDDKKKIPEKILTQAEIKQVLTPQGSGIKMMKIPKKTDQKAISETTSLKGSVGQLARQYTNNHDRNASASDRKANDSQVQKLANTSSNKPSPSNVIKEIKEKETDSAKCHNKGFYCHKCGLYFEDFEKLHEHIFKSSDDNHSFRCANCSYIVGKTLIHIILHTKRFCSREDFKKSEEVLAQEEPDLKRYYCERCGKGVALLTDLLVHYEQHKGETLCCSLCEKRTLTFLELLLHFRDHTVVGNISLQCKKCPSLFYASGPTKVHYYTVHFQMFNIPFECDLCTTVFFDDEEKFLFHVQGHCRINNEIKPGRPRIDVSKVTCEICAEIFGSVSLCKKHKADVHKINLDADRQCPQCQKNVNISGIPGHLLLHQKEKFVDLLKRNSKDDGAFEEEGEESEEEVTQPQAVTTQTAPSQDNSASQMVPSTLTPLKSAIQSSATGRLDNVLSQKVSSASTPLKSVTQLTTPQKTGRQGNVESHTVLPASTPLKLDSSQSQPKTHQTSGHQDNAASKKVPLLPTPTIQPNQSQSKTLQTAAQQDSRGSFASPPWQSGNRPVVSQASTVNQSFTPASFSSMYKEEPRVSSQNTQISDLAVPSYQNQSSQKLAVSQATTVRKALIPTPPVFSSSPMKSDASPFASSQTSTFKQTSPSTLSMFNKPFSNVFKTSSSLMGQIKCSDCDRTFMSIYALTEHQKSHLLEQMTQSAKSSFTGQRPAYLSTVMSTSQPSVATAPISNVLKSTNPWLNSGAERKTASVSTKETFNPWLSNEPSKYTESVGLGTGNTSYSQPGKLEFIKPDNNADKVGSDSFLEWCSSQKQELSREQTNKDLYNIEPPTSALASDTSKVAYLFSRDRGRTSSNTRQYKDFGEQPEWTRSREKGENAQEEYATRKRSSFPSPALGRREGWSATQKDSSDKTGNSSPEHEESYLDSYTGSLDIDSTQKYERVSKPSPTPPKRRSRSAERRQRDVGRRDLGYSRSPQRRRLSPAGLQRRDSPSFSRQERRRSRSPLGRERDRRDMSSYSSRRRSPAPGVRERYSRDYRR